MPIPIDFCYTFNTILLHFGPVKFTRVHEAKCTPWCWSDNCCWHFSPLIPHMLGTTQPQPLGLQSQEQHGQGSSTRRVHFNGRCSSALVAGSIFIIVNYSSFPHLSTWRLAQPCWKRSYFFNEKKGSEMHPTIKEFSLIRTEKHTCDFLTCPLLRFPFSVKYVRSTFSDKWHFSSSSQGAKLTLKRQKHEAKRQRMPLAPLEGLLPRLQASPAMRGIRGNWKQKAAPGLGTISHVYGGEKCAEHRNRSERKQCILQSPCFPCLNRGNTRSCISIQSEGLWAWKP